MAHPFQAASRCHSTLRPVAKAAHLTCLAMVASGLWMAPGVQAQTAPAGPTPEATLPTVTVTADPGGSAGVVNQQRAASVGKSGVAVQDTPFSIGVIDAEQAREAGAKNVQDALLYSAGVYAGRYGFDTRGDWAAIRGLSPSAYVDGLRGIYGFYNNVRPEFYTLERVEVLKGPSSGLYGQADLGGIVNVVTKRPQKTAAREINLQVGSHSRKQVAADFTGPLNQDGSLLYRLVALQRESDTQVDHVNDDALVVMPSLTWQPNADTSLTLQYIHQKNESKVSSQFLPQKGTLDAAPLGTIPISRFVGEPGWDRYDTSKDEFSVFWDQRLSSTWKLSANLRKTRSDSVTREIYAAVGPIPDDAGNMPRTIHTADRETDVLAADVRLEAKAQWGSTRHTFAVGVDHQNAQWDEFNYSNSATGGGDINLYNPVYGYVNTGALTFSDRPDNKIVQTGVYVMDHMEWGPWVLSGAVRHDRASNELQNIDTTPDTVVKNTATTGRLGLMYRMANGFSPYVSASTAFNPNLGTDGTASNSYLKPTTGEQTEAGVKYLSASGKTSAAFALFDIQQKNRLANGATPGGVEQVGARTKGWELAWRQRMGALELLANYTRLDAVNPQTGQRLSSVPESTASAWAQYHFNTGWRMGLGARHVGDVTGTAGRPVVPSVNLFDAMVGYTVGAWDWRLNFQNLSDKAYVSWCRGLNQDCGFGEGRNVVLSASYKF
jgi:iron complex outermembrane receptor protein